MGSYQGKADTTKITHSGKNEEMQFICMEMRGWRKSMQDSAIYQLEIQTPKNETNFKNSLFAVFDGHGTSYISRYLQQNLVSVLISLQQYKNQLYVEALDKTFMLLDDMMLSKEGQERLKKIKDEEDAGCKQSRYHIVGSQIGDFCGSTANVVLITEKFYYIANTGDSRSILCRNGYTIGLSRDHKPENPLELKRIKKANGFVSMGRVNDILSVSRAFGDFDMKQDRHLKWEQQIITCKPDIQVFAKSPRDDFILIACDGIWQNSQKSKTIVEMFIKEKSFQKQNYLLALEQLFNKLVARNVSQPLGQDNMTALFIKFNRPQDQQNWQERLHVEENVLWEQRNKKMRRTQSNIN